MGKPKFVFASAFALALAGCAAITAIKTGQPLDPAAVAKDRETAFYLLKASGCDLSATAVVAAPFVSIAADANGQQVLTKLATADQLACQVVVPPSALPVPAPANAPAAVVSTVAPAAK